MSAAAPAAAGGEAFGQHAHDGVEILARQLAVGPARAAAVEERGFRPILRRDLGDDLLGEHVERPVGDRQPVELAAPDAVEQRRAFDQIVARQRKEPPLGRAADRVAGAADALQEGRDRARRAELADEVDVADVDAELERGGRDQRLEFAALEPLLGREAELLGHAAVMRGDRVLAEPLGELAGDALGHAARVDEHERRAVLLDELGEAPIDLRPHVARHHRFERRVGDLDAEVADALMAGVDDRDIGRRVPVGATRRPGNARRRSIGFCVAERPIRCSRSPQSAASRSSDSARCAPRLFGAMAWISSTITVRAVASILRPDSEPSRT